MSGPISQQLSAKNPNIAASLQDYARGGSYLAELSDDKAIKQLKQ
jgi:hypothetical protein